MALPILPTPILKGEDAEKFLANLEKREKEEKKEVIYPDVTNIIKSFRKSS